MQLSIPGYIHILLPSLQFTKIMEKPPWAFWTKLNEFLIVCPIDCLLELPAFSCQNVLQLWSRVVNLLLLPFLRQQQIWLDLINRRQPKRQKVLVLSNCAIIVDNQFWANTKMKSATRKAATIQKCKNTEIQRSTMGCVSPRGGDPRCSHCSTSAPGTQSLLPLRKTIIFCILHNVTTKGSTTHILNCQHDHQNPQGFSLFGCMGEDRLILQFKIMAVDSMVEVVGMKWPLSIIFDWLKSQSWRESVLLLTVSGAE